MSIVAFDTLKAANRLRDAGFDEKQAHELVATFAEGMGENVATKDDIQGVRTEIESLRKEMKADNEALRKEMKTDNETLRKDVMSEIETLRKEMKTNNDALRKEMKTDNEALRKDVMSEVESLRQETRSEFKNVRTEIGGLRTEMSGRLDALEQRMTVRLGGMIVAGVMFLTLLDRLFPPG